MRGRGREREGKGKRKFIISQRSDCVTFFSFSFCRLQLRDFSEKVIDTKAAGYNVPRQYASGMNIGGAGVGIGIGATGSGTGVGAGVAGSGSDAQMEVDSNASTPA